ncbi:MAG TPA: hypothetical protein VES02_10505 [Dermatophilaceae bacterium]|nr:hypothetical protein [Dermatophilaceae bacterium]
MISQRERPTLREFLAGFTSRTGDPLEGAALAEMSGYTVADAREQGWPDIFAAARAVPVDVEAEPWSHGPGRRHPGSRALLRGLTYTLPVVALWAIFPWPVTRTEIGFLALLVVLSWGGSMASSHVVGAWLPGDARKGWRIAIAVVMTATLLTAVASGVMVRQGLLTSVVAVVGCVQVIYFFSASPLMLREHNPGLVVAAVVGATAGAAALLASLPEPSPLAHPEAVDVLRMVAGECLVVPAMLLVRQAWESSRVPGTPGYSVHIVRRDVVAFGAYGVMFGCLVLWIPVVRPSAPASILNLVIVGGIALAEVAVTILRERSDALLARPFDAGTFARNARRLIVSGVFMYVVPVALVTATLAVVLSHGSNVPPAAAVMAALTVICLGAVQVLSLIGMTLYGIRQVAMAISVGTLALMGMTPFMSTSIELSALYLAVLVALGAVLLAVVMRVGSHPINFL